MRTADITYTPPLSDEKRMEITSHSFLALADSPEGVIVASKIVDAYCAEPIALSEEKKEWLKGAALDL